MSQNSNVKLRTVAEQVMTAVTGQELPRPCGGGTGCPSSPPPLDGDPAGAVFA
ncbi:hypothetical protein ACFQ10_00555 [Streptomyces indonesiensis]